MLRALSRRCRALHSCFSHSSCCRLHNEAEAAREQAAAMLREQGGQSSSMQIFDSQLKSAQRDRASRLRHHNDPLLTHVTDRLLDRLEDCVAKFPVAVVLGGAGDYVARRLVQSRVNIQRVIHIDSSPGMLALAQAQQDEHATRHQQGNDSSSSNRSPVASPQMEYVLAQDEVLPLEPGSVDLVISCLGLHWANDLPGVMTQCRLALKPDGLFLAALFGGETLQELRIACSVAQMEREGGISPFISPLAQVRDAGNLLTRAGLALPTVDVDSFVMRYATPVQLVQHLRCMGESSALSARRQGVLRRSTALAAAAAYQGMFAEDDGSIPATFQVMYMTGWSCSKNTPKAARRGSATISFKEFAEELEGRGGSAGGPGADNAGQHSGGSIAA